MKRTTLIGMAAVVAVLTCIPFRPAYAYIDPNSAGALYQFLFPLLIAIGSAFAFLRRTIVRACTKVAHAMVAIVRRDRGKEPPENRPPSRHGE
ncbi:MAG TPA: hypothetical protein VGR92_02425 [Steroidobacteraceae bacterium]|nr:hypothetical protein [Steroidobacteraceae bacterium]